MVATRRDGGDRSRGLPSVRMTISRRAVIAAAGVVGVAASAPAFWRSYEEARSVNEDAFDSADEWRQWGDLLGPSRPVARNGRPRRLRRGQPVRAGRQGPSGAPSRSRCRAPRQGLPRQRVLPLRGTHPAPPSPRRTRTREADIMGKLGRQDSNLENGDQSPGCCQLHHGRSDECQSSA
jgi:hypothetical protein